jgi:hypothetical protein
MSLKSINQIRRALREQLSGASVLDQFCRLMILLLPDKKMLQLSPYLDLVFQQMLD